MVDRSSVCFVEHHKKLHTIKRMVINRKNKNKSLINVKLIKISKTRVIKAYHNIMLRKSLFNIYHYTMHMNRRIIPS